MWQQAIWAGCCCNQNTQGLRPQLAGNNRRSSNVLTVFTLLLTVFTLLLTVFSDYSPYSQKQSTVLLTHHPSIPYNVVTPSAIKASTPPLHSTSKKQLISTRALPSRVKAVRTEEIGFTSSRALSTCSSSLTTASASMTAPHPEPRAPAPKHSHSEARSREEVGSISPFLMAGNIGGDHAFVYSGGKLGNILTVSGV